MFTRRKPIMQLTVYAADDKETKDLQALGIDLHAVDVRFHATVCEHAQAQILARLLAQIGASNHIIQDSPILAALLQAPEELMREIHLRASADEGRDQ